MFLDFVDRTISGMDAVLVFPNVLIFFYYYYRTDCVDTESDCKWG